MSENNQLQWQRTNLDNIEQAWDGDLWDRQRLQCGAILALN